MPEYIEEEVTTVRPAVAPVVTPVAPAVTTTNYVVRPYDSTLSQFVRVMWYLLGLLEGLFAVRFLLALFGESAQRSELGCGRKAFLHDKDVPEVSVELSQSAERRSGVGLVGIARRQGAPKRDDPSRPTVGQHLGGWRLPFVSWAAAAVDRNRVNVG